MSLRQLAETVFVASRQTDLLPDQGLLVRMGTSRPGSWRVGDVTLTQLMYVCLIA